MLNATSTKQDRLNKIQKVNANTHYILRASDELPKPNDPPDLIQ